MRVFQLDECCNGKKFATACARQGKVEVWRYPRELRGAPDSRMVTLLAKGNPLLTLDWALLRENFTDIPPAHPGVVVVHLSDSTANTMTEARMAGILGRIKSAMVGWESLPLDNAILALCDDGVEVLRRADERLDSLGLIFFDASDFGVRTRDLIQAAGGRLLAGP